MATKRQTWAIFTLGGGDVRDKGLSNTEASELIARLKKEKEQQKQSRLMLFQKIWDEAVEAGNKELANAKPTPMIVAQHQDMLDDSSPIEKNYYVEGGACGFAWVNIAPGTQPFAKWVKEQGYGSRDSYYGGITVWCHEGGQSIERKEAWVRGFSRTLDKYGISSYTMSRLD